MTRLANRPLDTATDSATFLTVKETADYLRLSAKQIRRLISRGELPAHQFGTAIRITQDDINTYVSERRVILVK